MPTPPPRRLLAALLAAALVLAGPHAAAAPSTTTPPAPLPGDLGPLPPPAPGPTPAAPSPNRDTPTPSFTISTPFHNVGGFGARQQAYLDMLAARAKLASARQPDLATSLAGAQAHRDLLERANLTGASDSLPALQRRLHATQPAAPAPWQGLAEALPGLSLLSPRPLGLPAPAGGGAAPQAPLASQLISMLSLEQLSGGQAVDPAAFVAGRAEAVDVCKAAILGRITDLAGNPGSPAPAGRCLGTPVALAHTDRAPMDPERFRQRLQQLPGQAGESLLHQHRDNRDRAQNPQAPPKLPEELTQSTSTCRSMDHNLDEATGWFPPLGPVTNVLEHLCLLGWN